MPHKKNIHSEKEEYSRLPDYGPCEIENWDTFLHKSKSRFESCWGQKNSFDHSQKLSEFEKLTLLGRGSFGDVILIKHKNSDNFYAMKSMEKEVILKQNQQIDRVKNEKRILQCIDFPFTVHLEFFFKDNSFIYMVMPFILGGELFTHLKKLNKLNEVQARFFASQVILALEYLHYLDFIYRDVKPENILVDHTGYVKMTDFGACKRTKSLRTYTLCGTPEYLAPEIILSKGYGKSVDWWAIGVLIYEMVAGRSPFFDASDLKMYKKIISGKFKMPNHFSAELKDLVSNILQVDASRRYGNLKGGVNTIKDHEWFKHINWMAVLNRKATAPFKPKCGRPGDTRNFETISWTPPVVAQENQFESEFIDI